MRSLEEWTKYLEQQEQTLRRTSSGEATPDKAQQGREEPAKAASPPAPKPAVPGPVTPPKAGNVQRASMHEAQPSARGSADTIAAGELQAAVRLRRKLMAGIGQRETARKSYKEFKETREELLQRLLDPALTLEDAARLLKVCPTTVRRYTNRGLLKHFRTAGNQRRFRLSDVLAFLESQASGKSASD